MEYIAHRKNSIDELIHTSTNYGIEIDIRTQGEQLILNHDPYTKGESLEKWLEHYRHGTLILNVKEEGLESRLVELMQLYKIERYFFLDQSFPFLVRWSKLGHKKSAVRFSEYEPIELALKLEGLVDWVWVDCFNQCPLDPKAYRQLKDANFKICIVSPELQGRWDNSEINNMHQYFKSNQILLDAICTKKPEVWMAQD